ncbi:acyl-CoA dehydrogenase family protein [Bacillus sp. ISL-4]|uniref:acyl-CoA dehydrogenase family protein n=1 Tax=Bacillus sp. ISL-4 TaxID=2819125 RepID=UPI001BEB9F3A|nr:acyl-CoA dehydrogenase family protein [Bacillus sp. ISL-4]MBT2664285.1 acyl-CoA dehydrogenase family protein [Bacillus sp. ISL-4]MBT2669316.1 acyl-CoA dehydrogenase family protein [Streptomyces sp. ISL-14]
MNLQLSTSNSIKAEVGAMPETKGLNFFKEDLNLPFILHRYLSKEDYDHALSYLTELGEIAGTRLDELSRTADKHTPELIAFNGKGERVNEVDYHPAYKEMEYLGYSKFGLAAMSHKPVLGFSTKLPHVLKYAFWYLFVQSEFGLACPMSMTDSGARVLRRYADQDMQDTYLPHLTSTDMKELWTCAQFMTEKQGGSDVGANTLTAKKVGDQWELWGDKWFCSNLSTDLALVLARPEGAPAGTKGLGMFLMPRKLPDGSLNKFSINRIKDKLGTRDMASGEVAFEGAVAYAVGDVTNGFKQMMSMVNSSRLSNAVRSTAMMRRSFLEALISARGRVAFGSSIAEKPLMKETLFELLLDSEAAAAMTFFTASVYDKADQGSKTDEKLLRILTPLLKGYICKRARNSTSEGMEARGGNGYIEDWVEPKLVRDAHLGAIWEGTTNIVALDVIRSLVKDQAGEVFFNTVYNTIDGISDSLAQQTGKILLHVTNKIESQAKKIMNLNGPERELPAKQLMNRMYHVCAASLLLEEASVQITEQGSYRKLYMTLQYLHRYLLSNSLDNYSYSDPSLLQWFDAIVDWEQVPVQAVRGLLKQVQQSVKL